MTSLFLLSSFLFASGSLSSSAAETATRIQSLREAQARESRQQHRAQDVPVPMANRRVQTAEDRDEFRAAVSRLRENREAALACQR